MSYIKQTFIDQTSTQEGTTLKAEHLIHMEDGIATNDNAISGLSEQIRTLQSGAFSECIMTRYEPVNKSIFKGKKLWVFGDSITAGVGTDSDHYFSQMLCDNLECASLKRLGNSGYAFSHGLGDYGSCILNKMDSSLATAPGNCDILIVCFGVNDWTWGRNQAGDRAIGNLLDTTKYTICGAVNLFCQKLQTIFKDYPDVKIYFSTPTPTKNAPISGGNPAGKSWDQSKKNFNGNTLRDICNAIIQTAALYGYQSLDLNLYFDGDINNHSEMDIAFPDGLHPSAAGNEKMAITLEKLMCANPITAFTFNPLAITLSPLAKNLIYKDVKVKEAEAPTITTQPSNAAYELNATATPLTISAIVSDGGTLSYQWYQNNSVISGATTTSYTPTTSASGTKSYYCLVTNTLDGATKSTKSNVVNITVNSGSDEPTTEVSEVDLTTLSFNHLALSNATGEDNLFYQTSDQTISVNSTGWYKSSYAAAPLQVGTEIELTTYFGETTGNAILIYSENDINNPSATNNSYWPASSIFGLYASGSDNASETLYQWDNQTKTAVSGTSAIDLNGGKKLVLKLTSDGVKVFINDSELTMHHYNPLTNGNYYFGMHMNSSTSGELGAMIKYIGPLR